MSGTNRRFFKELNKLYELYEQNVCFGCNVCALMGPNVTYIQLSSGICKPSLNTCQKLYHFIAPSDRLSKYFPPIVIPFISQKLCIFMAYVYEILN